MDAAGFAVCPFSLAHGACMSGNKLCFGAGFMTEKASTRNKENELMKNDIFRTIGTMLMPALRAIENPAQSLVAGSIAGRHSKPQPAKSASGRAVSLARLIV